MAFSLAGAYHKNDYLYVITLLSYNKIFCFMIQADYTPIPIPNFKERLDEIIEISYKILCRKITCREIDVYNEASMQLQFSVILKLIGSLYIFKPNEVFKIELEKKIKIGKKTLKSPNESPRCDIFLCFYDQESPESKVSACIEMKYFKHGDGETVTDNRIGIIKDIENLEAYQKAKECSMGYSIVYTDNCNYPAANSPSKIKIGNGHVVKGKISLNAGNINLKGEYPMQWDMYEDNYFMKLKVD